MLRAAKPDAADEIAERADRACRPLEGRRLWFVGIGGAGLSAYAQLARAWGAEVGGWDRVATVYLDGARRRARRDRARAGRARRLGGGRLGRVPGRRRAGRAPSSSPSSSGCAASIVVGGHARQGHDGGDDRVRPARDRPRPGLADRRAGAAARRERRRGGGLARRRGRRVRPLGVRPAGRDRGRDERRARPPHRVRVARRARARRSPRWTAPARARRSATRPPFEGALAVPGEHNRRNAGTALAALELAGVPRAEAEPALARFTGTGPPLRGLRGGRRDDRRRLRPSPERARRDDRGGARGVPGPAAARRSSSRTSTRARAISPPSSARRSRPPTTSR